MYVVTKDEITKFVNGQPDDTIVNMDESIDNGSCVGCLMVQFARHKGWGQTECAFRKWWTTNSQNEIAKFEEGLSIRQLVPILPKGWPDLLWPDWPDHPITYGQIKEHLNEQ